MHHITLKNGLRVLLNPIKGTDTVTALVFVRIGSRYESLSMNGVTHFVEHLMFKGTQRRPNTQKITRALDAIGAEFNAFTSKCVTGYYIKSDRKALPLSLDILSDMLFNSKFDEKEINREKGVIIEEINLYRENPIHHVEDLIEEALFDGHVLGRNVVGTHKTIKEMPREEIYKYYKSNYSPSNMILVVSGNIDSHARTMIEKCFGRKKSEKDCRAKFEPFVGRKDSKLAPHVRIQTKKTEQIQITIGFPSYGIDDDRNAALSLLSIVLGGNMSSRLFIQVRERRGLAYRVGTDMEAYEDVGYFIVRAGLDQKRLPLAMKTIMNELRSVARSGITNEELKDAKTFLHGQVAIQMEDSFHQAEWYAKQKMFHQKVRSPHDFLKIIDTQSVLDVKRVAKEVIDFSKMGIGVVGPYEDRDDFLRRAKLMANG
ncbi:insulinase family protein [Candidatus Uhrbacteria bacterium]|nr:insulinase family protein [Candidatus Uhrbacteria bacterium]